MLGLVLILTFPILLALGYGGLYMLSYFLGRGREALDQSGFLLYPLFLAVPFGVALSTAYRDGAPADLGVAQFRAFGLSPFVGLMVILIVGTTTGFLFFYNELYLSRILSRLTRRSAFVHRLSEGKSEEAVLQLQQGSLVLFLIVSLFIAFAEEFLWRAYLLHYLGRRLSLPLGLALLISAASFGLNHYYFGLRNVFLKTLTGLLWGGLYLVTSSLLVCVVSHFTFNCAALLRQATHAPDKDQMGG
jgi:membrane protease YdiL (CAAX protease family)